MPVLKQLKQELDIITSNINHARGSGRLTPLANRGVGGQSEKEILSVIVEEAQADAVFAFIFRVAEIDNPHGGLMFQSALSQATQYQVPAGLPPET